MEDFFYYFIFYIFPIILSVVSGCLVFFIKKASDKYCNKVDIDIRNLSESLLMQIVQQGVTYAEQWGKNYLASQEEKPHGNQKMDMALKFIAEELKRHNIPDVAEHLIKNKIESLLGLETMAEINFPIQPNEDGGYDENFDN